MKVAEWIKRHALPVILKILKIFVKPIPVEPEDIDCNSISKILVVGQDAGLGNLVLMTPLLSGLKAIFPGSEVNVLVSDEFKELYKHNSDVDRTIGFNKIKACFLPWRYSRFIYCLRGEGYDLAVDASSCYCRSFHNMFLVSVSGAQYRLGYDMDDAKSFFNLLAPLPSEDTYIADVMFNLAKYIDPEVQEFPLSYHISDNERAFANEWLKEKNITEFDSFFVIHPGGIGEKQWGAQNFAELIKRIHSIMGVRIVVIGTHPGEGIISHIQALSKEDFDILRNVTIGQMAAVIERCDMFISNDSGPMHISIALNRPTVGIFISSDFRVFGPRGENGRIVLGEEELPAIDDVLIAIVDLLGGFSKMEMDNQERVI